MDRSIFWTWQQNWMKPPLFSARRIGKHGMAKKWIFPLRLDAI